MKMINSAYMDDTRHLHIVHCTTHSMCEYGLLQHPVLYALYSV